MALGRHEARADGRAGRIVKEQCRGGFPLGGSFFLLRLYWHIQRSMSITYFINKKVQLFQVLRRWPGREFVGAFKEGQVGLDGGFVDL